MAARDAVLGRAAYALLHDDDAGADRLLTALCSAAQLSAHGLILFWPIFDLLPGHVLPGLEALCSGTGLPALTARGLLKVSGS